MKIGIIFLWTQETSTYPDPDTSSLHFVTLLITIHFNNINPTTFSKLTMGISHNFSEFTETISIKCNMRRIIDYVLKSAACFPV